MVLMLVGAAAFRLAGQEPNDALKRKGVSGNPVFRGWYADPEAIVYGTDYWIFPTWSDDYGPAAPAAGPAALSARQKRSINPQYLKQTYFDAFSSKDLVHWDKHPRVLDVKDVSWAEFALWAPSAIRANGKYYLFFGANDIQSDQEEGGIGVAMAARPEGPYRDAIGRPLIDTFHNGAQPIDPFVFRDDDGQHYLYYGGWRHCNVVRLAPDLLGVVPFADGQLFKEVTPANYVEGPFVFRRYGKYYLMWSEGGWQGPNYSVAYAIGDSPAGPFTRIGKVLQQDPAVATGAGHHSVIPVAGSDTWYIVYHRRPLGTTNGNHREVCIDEMRFNPDGTIQPVTITFEGVKARPLPAPLRPAEASFSGRRPGDERDVEGIRLCWCPPGRFLMGSPAGERDRRPDEDQIEVTLSRGFWMAKFEVTQGLWTRISYPLPGGLTAELPAGDDLPVGNVNFAEAEAFCRKITQRAHDSGALPRDWEFRLPTEAQWEYACRAGTTTATAFGDSLSSRQANFKGKSYNGAPQGPSLGRAANVGSYPPNAWGLHDMHGNTFEWCRDWYHARLPGGVDPDLRAVRGTPNRDGTYSRVRRGGAWDDDGWACRSAFRLRYEPDRRYDHIGFRAVVLPVDGTARQ